VRGKEIEAGDKRKERERGEATAVVSYSVSNEILQRTI